MNVGNNLSTGYGMINLPAVLTHTPHSSTETTSTGGLPVPTLPYTQPNITHISAGM